MSLEGFPQQKNPENSNEQLQNALLELSAEDQKITLEEFKIAINSIRNIQDKIGAFTLITEASPEIQGLHNSGKLPEMYKNRYGTQEDLDALLDTLQEKKEYLNALKSNLLNKDMDAITEERSIRIKNSLEQAGIYNLSGEEVQAREDSFNDKIEQEAILEQMKETLNRLSRLN